MEKVIVYVDRVAQRAEVQAMCDRANGEAMRRVFGHEQQAPAPRSSINPSSPRCKKKPLFV